jgi:VWFA-related protein
MAASRYIETDPAPTDRVAVFTVSGQKETDFTDDRAKIEEDLKNLMPHGATTGDPSQKDFCPLMDYYEAVEIEDYRDPEATSLATADAMACIITETSPGAQLSSATLQQQAQNAVQISAQHIATIGDEQVASALRRLDEVTRRMSALPGQRSIVFISPGFIYPNREFEFSELIDRALRENVFINTIDARGLYTPGAGDMKTWELHDPNSVATAEDREKVRINGENSQMQMLRDLALGTGGLSIHDKNDLDAGLREIVSAPEAYYLLAFVPQNLKYDGHFHSLQVELTEKNDYTIQARKGFYSPKHGETPEQAATRDIMDALFSQEPHHGLPIALSTQFFKTSATAAKLTVLAHVDVAHVRFDKVNGLDDNDLTVATALFDRNGNFVVGTQKIVAMKLLDETVAKLSRTGVTIRTDFDVKPGDYVVRLVVRDGNSAQLATESGTVEVQ